MQNKFTEVANKITTIKTGFAEAITAKGVETLPSASFGDMITNIGNITGGGTVEPEQPIEEWVKPYDWPDIEVEPLEPNEIRILMCDLFEDGKQQITLSKKSSVSYVHAMINWGDGSPEEEVMEISTTSITHTFNKENGTPCDRGYNTYIVKIKFPNTSYIPRSISFRHGSSGVSNIKMNNILWLYGDYANIESIGSMFSDNYGYIYTPLLEKVNLLNVNNINGCNYAFRNCMSLYEISDLDISKCNETNYMFYNCYVLQRVPQLDTSNVTNFSYMFENCYALREVPELNTSKAKNMNGTFRNCTSLKKIRRLDTSNVTGMVSIFEGCTALKNIPELNASKCTNMNSAFNGCRSLRNVIILDTSNVTDFSNKFSGCYLLENIPELDTSKATRINGIFRDCKSLKKTPPINTSKSIGSYDNYEHYYGCASLIDIGTIILASNIEIMIGDYSSKPPVRRIDFAYDEANPPVFVKTAPVKLNYTQLNADDLNKLMTQLPDGNGKTLDLKYNPGSATCDPSIATAKNWTVLI